MTTTNTLSIPEAVALELMHLVLGAEGKHLLTHKATEYTPATTAESRQSILDTYAECLRAVKDQRSSSSMTVTFVSAEKEEA